MARVACGRSHTAAITATGGLYVWGSSALGTCLERHRRSCGSAYAALAVSTVLTLCPMCFTGQLGLDASTPVEWIDEFGRHHAVDQEERDTPFVAIPTPLRWSGMSRVGDMTWHRGLAHSPPPPVPHTCSCFRCRFVASLVLFSLCEYRAATLTPRWSTSKARCSCGGTRRALTNCDRCSNGTRSISPCIGCGAVVTQTGPPETDDLGWGG